ncbi:MAG TPA: hypothetical protein VMF65_22850 [Acidimicrobiales bacterium]|nr:hypothetical protein [Acidimicrobiales bacterium]
MTTVSTVVPGSVEARPGRGSTSSRLFPTCVGLSKRRQQRAGAVTAAFCVAFAGAMTGSPAYAASPSWLAYVNTQTGRTCSIQSTSATAASGKTAKETMTLLSKSATASGTLLHYRIVTSVGAAGSVKTVTTNSTWEIFGNGSVGLPPGFSGSSGGYTVTFDGSELYPSPGQLQAGQTATRVLTLTLAGSTGQAAAALSELAANGKTLTLQLTVKASAATTVASIATPGGTYHDPVGVVTSVQSMKPLNGSALLDKSWVLLSSTFSQFLTSTIYFAPGIGPVKLTDPGAGLTLESAGCSG